MMSKKFQFKRHKKETGTRSVGYEYPSVDIKLNGKVVGLIVAPTWQTKDHKWGVSLSVVKPPTKDDPSPWKWVTLKARFDSEVEARAFVLEKSSQIINLNLIPI